MCHPTTMWLDALLTSSWCSQTWESAFPNDSDQCFPITKSSFDCKKGYLLPFLSFF